MVSTERLAEVVSSLERASELLSELATDSLREGLEGDEEAAAAAVRDEKLLNRARSSLEKSLRLLSSLTTEE